MASRFVNVLSEFFHHAKLSVFAVVTGMAVIYFWPVKFFHGHIHWLLGDKFLSPGTFFHLFHYPHISLAAATSFLTIYRFSKNWLFAFVFSSTLPVFLCTLSDVLLPYIGGVILGVKMDLHLCITCNLPAALFFLSLGVLLGFLLCLIDRQGDKLYFLSLVSHFLHELASAVSSLVYMIGFGFYNWHGYLFPVLFLMIFAVVIPCLMSDFFVPLIAVKFFKGLDRSHSCCTKEVK